LGQAEEAETWQVVAGEGITATLCSVLTNPPKATSIWYPRQGREGAQKASRLSKTYNCLKEPCEWRRRGKEKRKKPQI